MHVETTLGIHEFVNKEGKKFSIPPNTGWEPEFKSAASINSHVDGALLFIHGIGENHRVFSLKDFKKAIKVGGAIQIIYLRKENISSSYKEGLRASFLVKPLKGKVMLKIEGEELYFNRKEIDIAIGNIERINSVS